MRYLNGHNPYHKPEYRTVKGGSPAPGGMREPGKTFEALSRLHKGKHLRLLDIVHARKIMNVKDGPSADDA